MVVVVEGVDSPVAHMVVYRVDFPEATHNSPENLAQAIFMSGGCGGWSCGRAAVGASGKQ